MSLYQTYSFGSDKTTVIFDIGEAYTKCGYAAENGPRSIIPSEIKNEKTGEVTRIYSYKNADELYASLLKFIHHMYFRHLMVNPKERRVVIVESLMTPTIFRDTLAKVLFKHFEVPSVLFAPSHLLALFTLRINSGLVMDVGFSETEVLPIYEGIPILKGSQTIPLAGKAIHNYLEAQLLESATVKTDEQTEKALSSILDRIDESILEDMKVRCCFVTRLERGLAIQAVSQGRAEPSTLPTPPPGLQYPLDGGKLLNVDGKLRENACEVLFEQDNEEKSLATLVLDSLKECPIDMRKELAGNLVIIGGTSMLPGFRHRLQEELKYLLEKEAYKALSGIAEFKFHNPPAKANYTAWLGGALFGALEVLASRSVTREQYAQQPIMPDWCSLYKPAEKDEKGVPIKHQASLA